MLAFLSRIQRHLTLDEFKEAMTDLTFVLWLSPSVVARALQIAREKRMRHEYMVGTRLPKELIKELELIEQVEHADRSTTLRKLLTNAVEDWKLQYYARQYGKRQLTLAKAAQAAGVNVWEMQEYTRAQRTPAQYDLNDLDHDLQVIKR